MNVAPDPSQFTAPLQGDHSGAADNHLDDVRVVTAEQAVVAGLLTSPQRVHQILARVRPEMFLEPLHGEIVALVARLTEEGRSPSLETLTAAFGNGEVADGLTVRAYLGRMLRQSLAGFGTPWQDAVEVVREAAMRRALQWTSDTLAAQSLDMGLSVADIAGDAVAALDEVISEQRAGKRRSYDAGGAAQSALDHLVGSTPNYPGTGLVDLDRVTGGWPRGQLTIIAGRPGMGKSATAVCCARQAARAGHPTVMFSLEMQSEQLGARLLCDQAYSSVGWQIFYEDILKRSDKIDDRARGKLAAASDELRKLPLEIDEQRGLTLAEISARARKIAANFDRRGQKLEVLLVDHIGLVRASGRYAGNRVRELAEISDGLATLAKELDIAVLGLCQLNRGVEGRDNKRPGLSDLRESGAIEEDASLVVFCYRPAYYLENTRHDDAELERTRLELLERDRNKLEFIVSKNRNGRIGVVDCFVDIGANAIRNAAFKG